MYALNFDEHLAWSGMSQPVRRWTRLWLDGNHSGTHIHWRLSPLSVLGLSTLWELFLNLERCQPQEDAIRRMACRRRHCGSFLGSMPEWGAPREAWEGFFASQLQASSELLEDALTWHRCYVQEATSSKPPTTRELWVAQNGLCSALIVAGYSSDDLFNRVKDGVVDAARRTGRADVERLAGFLDYFRNPTPRDYIVWTLVHHDTSWDSRTLERRFSSVALSHPSALKGDGPSFAWLQPSGTQTPVIVTKLRGTHSVKERHRLGALALLETRMRSSPALGRLSLDAETSYVLADNPFKEPWRYRRKRFALPMLSKQLAPGDGLTVGLVAQEIFDRPVDVIDEVFEFLEHHGFRKFWRLVPPTYHSSLRTDLGKAIADYRSRLSGLFRKPEAETLPPDVKLLRDLDSLRDFAELQGALRSCADCPDSILADRLGELVAWPHFAQPFSAEDKAFNSVHEIADLMTLARGLRNARTHALPIPLSVHQIAVYLAMMMLYAWSSVVRSQSRAPVATTETQNEKKPVTDESL